MRQSNQFNAVQIQKTGLSTISQAIAASKEKLLMISTLPLRLARPIKNSQNVSAPKLIKMAPKFALAIQEE